MMSLICTHPDILEFIKAKDEGDKITSANISVRFTDEFLLAVKNDKMFNLSFTIDATGEKIEKSVNARNIMLDFAYNNYSQAEPGALFWDRVRTWNLMSEDETYEYASTNPCLHPDSMIETVEGRVKIKDIKEPIGVYTMLEDGTLGIRTASASWISKKNAQTINITTRNGKTIRVTPEHKVMTHDGWVEAKDLKIGDRIVQLLRRRRGVAYSGVRLTSQPNGTDVMEHRLIAGYATTVTKNDDVHHIDGDTYNNALSNLEVMSHSEHSTITRYSCANDHQLTDDKGRFISGDGSYRKTIIPMPTEMQSYALNKFCNTVASITIGEVIDVYDLTVEDTHNFVADHMVVHNCGEIPTIGNGSCLLGSINLSTHVLNPFTSSAHFNIEEFKDSVRKSVVALNEVLDEGIGLHPTKEISDIAERFKQIGLGLCGYADMLIKMGIKYGSVESFALIDYIGSAMSDTALKTSALLARDKGAFPAMNKKKLLQSPYLQHNASESTMELIEKYGLRNSSLLCLAPTGSTAPMVNASWAAEPIYDVSYSIKTESLDAKESHYKVFTPIIAELMKVQGITDINNLPDYVVSTMQIPWRDRIKTQSHFQVFIDSAISSTVNLPEYVGVKDIYDLYMYAWQQGLKGVTVYRNNCDRGGVLTSTTETKEVKNCPTCGADISMVEGCKSCQVCGWSMCGL